MRLVKPSYEIRSLPSLDSIEDAGRTCYKSEGDDPEGFCRKIIKREHESVLEHESVSVRFIIDRGVSHELVRHRLCAFSQESTRYCDYGGGHVVFVIPPWVDIEPGEYNSPMAGLADSVWFAAMLHLETEYKRLRLMGWPPQQARSVLPNSLKTEIVVTANIREWRHIFKLRTASAAHPQMREVMIPLQEELRKLVPVVFDEEKK